MPIDYSIDHARQLVIARGNGVCSEADVFAYQRQVWSRPDVVGYDELVDMSMVEGLNIPGPATPGIMCLAAESAATDSAKPTKFAIVASSEIAFGIGRMYQTYREAEPRTTKEVRVFRTLAEAVRFLGIVSVEAIEVSIATATDRGRATG